MVLLKLKRIELGGSRDTITKAPATGAGFTDNLWKHSALSPQNLNNRSSTAVGVVKRDLRDDEVS